MASAVGAEDGPITAINVTPLVDIILVVLIIFMATAPLISRRAIKVDMPRAAHHERAATEALQVVFNAKREIFLNGRGVSFPGLTAELQRAVKSQPEVHVTLSADRTLPYGDIVKLLDDMRGAGVRKIGLEVVRRD